MNRQVEIDLGIRKPLSEIQTLAEQHTMCVSVQDVRAQERNG